MKKNILITGGAGFIGSNLAGALLRDDRVGKVRVLDNLATGFEKNIREYYCHSDFEFVRGDIRDYDDCLKACDSMNLVSHQAALGSVPRSINDPLTTNEVNISGTLNIFKAAVDQKIERVIFAASSSTYGDSKGLPKVEDTIGAPLSPYAVTKYVNELYAKVFSDTYSFNYIGLRYFNVFGPKQNPTGAYAAVIPLFLSNALQNKSPTINGDGSYSRDFTFVDNAVQANIKALFVEDGKAINEIYNIACGHRTSLNELWSVIKNVTGTKADAVFGGERKGDVPHSLASIEKAKELINYEVDIFVKKGIELTLDYMSQNLKT